MHLLIIRTSSMGDVAMITPVVSAFRNQYPEARITVLTRSTFLPFFRSVTDLSFFCPDFTGRHHGLIGIIKLFNDLSFQFKYDYIIDLHNVLRSKILCYLFRFRGIPVYSIDKGRKEKKDTIKGKNRGQLKHSAERYSDVFAKAGFPLTPEKGPWIKPSNEALAKISSLINEQAELNIGVAPYARHDLKMWPEEYMIKLLALIGENHRSKFFLFGGKEEQERLIAFQEKAAGSLLVSGNYNLDEEMALMTRLNFMITMDSSNMHMAALVGTRVISIWGGTDPITGFGAWQQPDNQALRIEYEVLTCRPCTVFGKGKCLRKDFACMIWLTPERVLENMVNLKII